MRQKMVSTKLKNIDIYAYEPDFEINAQGIDIADAIEMARDAWRMMEKLYQSQQQFQK